jgi:glycosyltransferase involved in cell wall biosynthesis
MHLVVSIVNLRPRSGAYGILSAFCHSLRSFKDVQTTVLCHSLEDVAELAAPGISFMAFPASRKCWLFRIFYEYVYFFFLARKLKPDYWLSLHDITPNLGGICHQSVYCHNSSPFYRAGWKELIYSPGFFMFSMFYKYLYRINIHKNCTVVVQQEWIRDAFRRIYNLDNILVASPNKPLAASDIDNRPEENNVRRGRFFYPSLPRVFKNFEVVCDAAEILYRKNYRGLEFVLTLDGTENRYAHSIYRRYKACPLIRFTGLLPKEKVYEFYQTSDALIFPSKLETWGLPISEFKPTGRPVFLAELPYAHETIGDYDNACFFNPLSADELADKIERYMNGEKIFQKVSFMHKQPYASNMEEMLKYLLDMRIDKL